MFNLKNLIMKDYGASYFISKPYNTKEVIKIIEE